MSSATAPFWPAQGRILSTSGLWNQVKIFNLVAFLYIDIFSGLNPSLSLQSHLVTAIAWLENGKHLLVGHYDGSLAIVEVHVVGDSLALERHDLKNVEKSKG